MARRKRKTTARVVAGLPVIRRQDDVLEPVYEADPDGRPVVHHRTVDTLGIMLRAGTITRRCTTRRATSRRSSPSPATIRPLHAADAAAGRRTAPGILTDAQLDARRRVGNALDALGGLGSPAGSCVWHVVGLQRSIREWAMRQGWAARPVRVEQAQGILVAALGVLARRYGYRRS